MVVSSEGALSSIAAKKKQINRTADAANSAGVTDQNEERAREEFVIYMLRIYDVLLEDKKQNEK